MASLWRHKPRKALAASEWIICEFAKRGLSPPNCTPEALARELERERNITIEFRTHESDDPGVYGLLYRKEGYERIYIVLLRQTYSVALRRQTMFHELAHILFDHGLTEAAGVGTLRGYMVSDPDDAVAEAFAVGAMQYSFCERDEPGNPTITESHVSTSAIGHFLMRTDYQS